MHKSRLGTIVIDCQADAPGPAAEFWSRALGWAAEPQSDPDAANYRELATAPTEVKVLVQAVAHPSRVHVDIETDDIDAEVARLEALGARRVAPGEAAGGSWKRRPASAFASSARSGPTSRPTRTSGGKRRIHPHHRRPAP